MQVAVSLACGTGLGGIDTNKPSPSIPILPRRHQWRGTEPCLPHYPLGLQSLPTVSPTMSLFFLLFPSAEDIIYGLQESSRVQLDGVQLCRNQRGESQPSYFSMKENVIPGE